MFAKHSRQRQSLKLECETETKECSIGSLALTNTHLRSVILLEKCSAFSHESYLGRAQNHQKDDRTGGVSKTHLRELGDGLNENMSVLPNI